MQGHSFVYWLDPNAILERIQGSSNSELYEFRNALQRVYDSRVYYENCKDDYKNLKTLYDGVQKMDTSSWGEVKSAYQNWIVNDLERYIGKIKPEERRNNHGTENE